MAVPKQKQSHARTTQRRAQHKVSGADLQRVPAVPQPPASAPRLPGLRQLQGARGDRRTPASSPAERPRRWSPSPWTRAGLISAPRRSPRAPPRAAAQGIGVLLFGPARRDRRGRAPASRSSTRRSRSPRPPTRRSRSARRPRPRSSRPRRAVADGRAQALVSGGSTGSALAAGAVQPAPRPRHLPARAGAAGADARRAPGAAARRRRQRHLPPRAPRPVRPHGLGVRPGGDGHRRPRAWRCCPTARSRARARRSWSPSTSSSPATAGTGLNFIGNIEGTQVTEGVADVVVMDGFTGNITLKLIEGVSGRTMRAIRDAAMSSTRGPSSAAGCWRPAVRELREEIDPERPGGAYMLGLRQLGRRRPRPLHPPRLCPRDRGRGARRPGGRDRRAPARALQAAGALRSRRGATATTATADGRARPSRRLRCRADDSRAGLLADPRPPGRRARGRSRARSRSRRASGRISRPTRSTSTRSSRSSRTPTA